MRGIEKKRSEYKTLNLFSFYLLSLNPEDIGHLAERNSLVHSIQGILVQGMEPFSK